MLRFIGLGLVCSVLLGMSGSVEAAKGRKAKAGRAIHARQGRQTPVRPDRVKSVLVEQLDDHEVPGSRLRR